MGQNLRARLQRIREAGRESAIRNEGPGGEPPPAPDPSQLLTAHSSLFPSSFHESGFQTLRRTTLTDLPLALPAVLPPTLPILIPDLALAGQERYRRAQDAAVSPRDLLFFDLETTGLSGGAGTVAFLAAFGRFVQGNNGYKLQIDQYLLLDYPGEGDFLETVLREFSPGSAAGAKAPQGGAFVPPLIVSYNGKSFDSQILKTRCLMNGMLPPVYRHADLLHPVRRLWKRRLPDCSQGTIETAVLGLDRTDDMPGAMAPEIWFDFLKNNDPAPLLGICDHNLRDIRGLAAIFISLCHIAADPLSAMDTYGVDAEQLALRWRDGLRRGGDFDDDELQRGQALLEKAADRGCPRAAYVLALDLVRGGKADEGRKKLHALVAGDYPAVIADEVKGLVYRQLAIDAEWRLRNPREALAHTEAALALENIREGLRNELETRRERLLLK